MKIDGYIINPRGSSFDEGGATYMPATIEKVGKSTVTAIAANGEKRTFNLEKDHRNSTKHRPVWLQPTKGQRLDERGGGDGYYRRPYLDMDVEAVKGQAEKASAATKLRNRYRKAYKVIRETIDQHGQDGSRADEAWVAMLEGAASLLASTSAPTDPAVSTLPGLSVIQAANAAANDREREARGEAFFNDRA